jgi:hypothetical protein
MEPQHKAIQQEKLNSLTQTHSASEQKFKKITKLESAFVDLLNILFGQGDGWTTGNDGLAVVWNKTENRFMWWIKGLTLGDWDRISNFLLTEILKENGSKNRGGENK